MRAIINGLRYDTEKAICIGSADNIGRGVDSTRDFGYWSAGLYKTPRSGKFFLAGEGGPMSQFGHASGQNSWSGGERIIPMERDNALEWAERHLEVEDVEANFADTIEDA